MPAKSKKAFTLMELLVVISIIAILLGVLMPALTTARSQAKIAICRSNLRQLVLANIGYAGENSGFFVPAASDIRSANCHRWHGVRKNLNELFEPCRGPLAAYLADGLVKQCPQRVDFVRANAWDPSYEAGCGGYGYNMTYIGSRIWEGYYEDIKYRQTAKDSHIGKPSQTLMFADTAMARLDKDRIYYQEYSFAEPRYFVINGEPDMTFDPAPSIHFRHHGSANVAWADGHLDSRQMANFDGVNVYGVKSADVGLGWFEPLDNSLFDLK